MRARGATLGVFWTALLAPAFAHAHSSLADDQFDCHSDPHTFIASLIEDNSIASTPTHIEADSVNAFKPVKGTRLSAFGMPVYAVFGYAPGDTLFRRGTGKEVDKPLYGVVVKAPAMIVRQRLREHNSDATVKAVVPLVLTAIVCGASG